MFSNKFQWRTPLLADTMNEMKTFDSHKNGIRLKRIFSLQDLHRWTRYGNKGQELEFTFWKKVLFSDDLGEAIMLSWFRLKLNSHQRRAYVPNYPSKGRIIEKPPVISGQCPDVLMYKSFHYWNINGATTINNFQSNGGFNYKNLSTSYKVSWWSKNGWMTKVPDLNIRKQKNHYNY